MKRYRVFEVELQNYGNEVQITDTSERDFIVLKTLNPESGEQEEALFTALKYVNSRHIGVVGTAYSKEKIYLISEDFKEKLFDKK